MKTNELVAEHRESLRTLRREHANFLIGLGISPLLISVYTMIGIVRMRPEGARWVPDEGGTLEYVTPVRVHDPLTPLAPDPWAAVRFGEIIDLVAWAPRSSRCLLRTGEAIWLGSAPLPQMDPFPPWVYLNVIDWLRAGADGVAVLSRHPLHLRRVLSALGRRANVENEADRRWLAAEVERGRQALMPKISVVRRAK